MTPVIGIGKEKYYNYIEYIYFTFLKEDDRININIS